MPPTPSGSGVQQLPSDIPHYELLRIKKLDALCNPAEKKWVYETVLTGYSLWTQRPAIFGGVSLGLGVQAAFDSIYEELGPRDAAEFRAYSYQGTFAGPASALHAIQIEVTTVRSTRSFVTRIVTLSQQDPTKPGLRRKTLVAICDFARRGRTPLVEFDAPALNPVTGKPWEKPEVLELYRTELSQRLEREQQSGDSDAARFSRLEGKFLGRWDGFLEYKLPPDSLTYQSSWAIRPDKPATTQDNVPVTDRVMVDYFRVVPDLSPANLVRISAKRPDCVPFRPETTTTTLFAFVLDQLVPIIPIVATKTPRKDAAPDVSLDFSIRFHREDGIDLNKWSLRQFKCLTAGAGRSFNQITVWDEEGRITGTISQQGHLVPAQPPKPKL
ncbi:hypothetical protein OC834_003956 [Tilletia horrida]|uniref:Thioesterase-like superfamily-domain-containing protein n=1 Tax=Tilletia horrida TaxID=155126 RepID=A0AAN6GJ41_9BASI|nr:hypothetical protein OC834_003956 [Tilletia horrida]KAK0533256.1 hypothetical protein OC835_003075 [Tilletia horrida]KAK0539786.1 hypothetical protein OC842_000826 [Tilletia horrida]KAK0565469.1 hypothetical protein OC844_001195 [Tilletia horrida]